jgi:hypothetical protein
MAASEAARRFHRDMFSGAEVLKREVNYDARRFTQMVAEIGGVEAAKRLLRGADTSAGLARLMEVRRLDLSVEAFVLLPWYRELFTDEELAIAERRLAICEFDLDSFLRRADASQPVWFTDSADP